MVVADVGVGVGEGAAEEGIKEAGGEEEEEEEGDAATITLAGVEEGTCSVYVRVSCVWPPCAYCARSRPCNADHQPLFRVPPPHYSHAPSIDWRRCLLLLLLLLHLLRKVCTGV